MAIRKKVRKFDKWLQGSSGSLDASTAEYNSANAQVYENGRLGPRPGWKELTQGNAIPDFTTDGVDQIKSFQWHNWTTTGTVEGNGMAENLVVMWRDSSLAKYVDAVSPIDVPTWTNTDKVLGSPTIASFLQDHEDDSGHHFTSHDGQVITISSGGVYKATDSSIGTQFMPSLPSSKYPGAATAYKDRMYYWGISSQPARIYFSVAANYENWDDGTTAGDATGWTDATSFFDVTYDTDSYVGSVSGVWSVKNALLIARKDSVWQVLTGSSPNNGSLRELGKDTTPAWDSAVVVENRLFFLDPVGRGVCIASPAAVETRKLNYLSPLAYPGSTYTRPNRQFLPRQGVADENTRDIVLPARPTIGEVDLMVAAERVNDVWNLSTWDHNIANQSIKSINYTKGRTNEMWSVTHSLDSGTALSTVEVYSRNFTLNRPGNSGDTKSQALSVEAGTSAGTDVVLQLGTIESDDDTLMRPVKVVLDLDYWKGGNYAAPELAIDATVCGIEADTPQDTATQIVITTSGWDNSTGDAPNTRRVSAAIEQLQWGTKTDVKVTFNNLAIDNVRVYYEETDDIR